MKKAELIQEVKDLTFTCSVLRKSKQDDMLEGNKLLEKYNNKITRYQVYIFISITLNFYLLTLLI